MDYYDVYELRDDSSSETALLDNVRGQGRLPEELGRFAGILKESTTKKEGGEPGRLFLEAAYHTPLP